MRDTSLIGRAKELEVASALIRNGIYVYSPLVDTGADLIAANYGATRFIPVQVKFRGKDPSLNLSKRDMARFQKANTVVAFLIGERETQRSWYVPISEWTTKAIDRKRRDEKVYVRVKENSKWLAQFEGNDGVLRSFASLLE